uniref:Exocyst component Exo84 C-terminal domain-containing protein n=1 Tax=Acrobeloides nanus TaxID=290746 RepID=A0A914E4H4_9BILA
MASEEQDDAYLLASNFNAAEHVNQFLKTIRSGEEGRRLQNYRANLQTKNNTASEAIKDVVFDHYRQFIETSKEISHLEREIYQLSSLLSEQKNLIENLMEMNGQEKRSSGSTSTQSGGNIAHHSTQTLLQKMDGVASFLNTLKENDRILLQNEMLLLDSETMEPVHPIYLVLFTDTLLIGHPTSGGKYRFHLSSTHSIDNLAVVNVKRAMSDLVLQLLIFPEQIYIKCENGRVKKEWFDGIEHAKRTKEQENSLVRQATIRAKRKSIAKGNGQQFPSRGRAHDNISMISEEGYGQQDKSPEGNVTALEDTQWLKDLINELQDVISHRHMEQAVEMILEWKSCDCKDPAINAKFASLEQTVVKMLSEEIRRPRALHGGAKAVLSRPLNLLKNLDRETYAVDLYLKRRSSALRAAARELTVSEEPLSYVRQASKLFVNEIVEVADEFKNQPKCYCLVLQWCSGELSLLLSLVRRNVIEVAPTMAVCVRTWCILLTQCDKLTVIGLDLSFEVHRLLAPALKTALTTNFTNIIESMRLRISEERWKPYNMETESNLNRYLEEMSDMGLAIDWAVSSTSPSRFYINVSQSGCHFARVSVSLCKDLALLKSSHLRNLCDSFVRMLWEEYLSHLASAPTSNIHTCTCQFIIAQVLPLCEETYDPSTSLLNDLLSSKFSQFMQYRNEESQFEEEQEEIANV